MKEKNLIESAFRESDVRGLVKTQITEEFALLLGKAIANTFKSRAFIVGRDRRKSSKALENALIKGITKSGADVFLLEDTLSPIAYFAARFYEFPGVFITASHNPLEYNGFKIIGKDGLTKGKYSGLNAVKREFFRLKKQQTSQSGKIKKEGSVFKASFFEEYKKRTLEFDYGITPLKLVVNTGGNKSGELLKKILVEKKVKIIQVLPKKGVVSNPLIDSGIEVTRKIRKEKADMGVAFDFDGDRTFFFDEKGEKIDNSSIAALIATRLLRKKPGSLVLYDVRSDWVIRDAVNDAGGKTLMVKVGHTNVKEKMKKHDAIYCGEVSGHNYFKETGYAESSFAPIIILLSLISKENKSLSSLVKPFRRNYLLNETNFEVASMNSIKITIKAVKKAMKGGKRSSLDGIRIDYPLWWFNLRGSKNEPVIRLTMGAVRKEILEHKFALLKEIILKHHLRP